VTTTTTYLGFVIVVTGHDFTVLDRNGKPVETVSTMSAARKVITRLRREEREAAT